jgi:4-diphosphocytidyl-2-C-methyl-D-erythritol kinase
LTAARENAPAKLNLALHVRGRLPDGRHSIETIFAFCIDGDGLSATEADELSLEATGPFAGDLDSVEDNLVLRAARALREAAGISRCATIVLDKRLPVASGIGGGSADAEAVAPKLGSDIPACLLSLPARGDEAGDQLTLIDPGELAGTPVLLLNPRVPLSTADVFAGWDGVDQGPLDDWREGRNGLETPATALVPQIETVLAWLATRPGATFARMSGSGATCFALFDGEAARDFAADSVPREWWRLATSLR